jgi:DNA-binding transcriptional LysR family regulator
MMTLRQIEVVRAVMISGTISGAAKLLNVSAPGISRLVKYTERSLGVRFFTRQNGRYFPTADAQKIFEQINAVYKKIDDLSDVIGKIGRGELSELRIGSVPSIAQVRVPRAVEKTRRRYPDLRMDINILKIEEAIDYLLLGKGDCAAISYRLDHPALDFLPLASGRLFCIVPEGHALAERKKISAAEMTRFPLIGIEPTDQGFIVPATSRAGRAGNSLDPRGRRQPALFRPRRWRELEPRFRTRHGCSQGTFAHSRRPYFAVDAAWRHAVLGAVLWRRARSQAPAAAGSRRSRGPRAKPGLHQ